FGFRAIGNDKYWDTVTVVSGANSFARQAANGSGFTASGLLGALDAASAIFQANGSKAGTAGWAGSTAPSPGNPGGSLQTQIPAPAATLPGLAGVNRFVASLIADASGQWSTGRLTSAFGGSETWAEFLAMLNELSLGGLRPS